MRRRTTLIGLGIAIVAGAVSAQTPLPAKMEGRWSNVASGHANKVEVELLNMETPTHARIKAVFWPYCRWTETTADLKDGAWEFTFLNCRTGDGTTEIPTRVRAVDGKNRLEGTYGTGVGKIYFEW